jgi:type I restriction enzyme M protein
MAQRLTPGSKAPGSVPTTRETLSSTIKSIRNIMRKDKGLNGDADRLPMLTWLMLLKFLDDAEETHRTMAELAGKPYHEVVEAPYRWRDWAAPSDGLTGDELKAFINQDEAIRPDGIRGLGLFAYLKKRSRGRGDVVANVFRELQNRMVSGYLLRDVVNKVSEISFTSNESVHTLSHLYESMLREMRDASGDSGEFYTPRPVVKFMISVLDPKLGERVLDPACGTGGFLVEAYEHMKLQALRAEDYHVLQELSIFGNEAKSLPYLLAQMNLVLHGVESPNITLGNSLAVKLTEIGDSERVDVIATNPPFGGEEERSIQGGFPADKRTSETALLFLQLIMRRLRRSPRPGRAAVVVPNGVLFGDGICAKIKEELVRDFNLHTVVRLGPGVFSPYTDIPTNILFFDRSESTSQVWFYELRLPDQRKKYSKTAPILVEEFDGVRSWWNARKEGCSSWRMAIEKIVENGYNLDIKNPHAQEEQEHQAPSEIVSRMICNNQSVHDILDEIARLIDSC